MRRSSAPIGLAWLAALLAASTTWADEVAFQLGDTPYQFRNLECEVKVPDGWRVERDDVTVVARTPGVDDTGFQLTREPFLYDEGSYADAWRRQLGDGGIDAQVEKKKVGRHTTWHATWENASAGGRRIAVWRVYVEDNEMLFNFAFSAPKRMQVDSLAEDVLKSFKCTAEKQELVLRETVDRLGTATDIRFPKAWDPLERGELGGLMQALGWSVDVERAYVKPLPGYPAPHMAVSAMVLVFSPYTTYGADNVRGNDTAGIVMYAWDKLVAGKAREIQDKPRVRGARHGRLRGDAAQGTFIDEQGFMRVFYAFGTKIASQQGKQTGYVIAFIADARELRLNKDLFKEILGTLREN